MTCGQFADLTSKTNLTYHLSKLREAGVINITPDGTRRRVTLRRADLDAAFSRLPRHHHPRRPSTCRWSKPP